MDIESDGSERWEDFFGSSTDIGPSVLGYLDTLAENFSEEAKQLVEQSLVVNNGTADSPPRTTNSVAARVMTKDKVTVSSAVGQPLGYGNEATGRIVPKPRRATKAAPSPLTKSLSPPRAAGHQRFCWNPSPTVQRLVAGAEVAGTEETQPQLECSNRQATLNVVRKHAPAAAAVTGVSCHKNLPLSKSMAKLTHANSEQLFEDDDHGHGELSKRHDRQLSPRATDVCRQMDGREDRNGNPANGAGAGGHDDDDDDDSGEMQNVSALQRKIRSLTVDLEKTDAEADLPSPKGGPSSTAADTDKAIAPCDANQEDTSVVLLRRNSSERIDHSRRDEPGGGGNAFVDNCVDLSEHRNTVVEARNLSIRHPTPDGTPDRQRRSRQEPQQQISCSKRRNDSNRKHPPPVCGEALSDGTPNQSTPSLDLAAGSSGYSSKVSLVMVSPGTPVLSSRPLSSSSLCSYSSSTSSGSEGRLVGGKCSAPSYQASVESLADHSEPEHRELKGGGAGPTPSSASVLGVVVGLTMCERAVREIIDSESSYVKDLGQVIRGYLEDWKERACLKSDQLKVLFSNIQEIYDFNSKLLNRLHEAKGDPMRISNCFIDLHAEFSCYTSYCTSYPEAISLLTTLLQATHTNALLVSTQKLLKHTLPLGSYLLKPVQRILKYHLLLENLRKHCGHQQVVLAYELMKQVAHNIDQVKTKLDQHRLVKELAGVLDGWLGPDLSVLGDLLHEGRLLEQGKARFVLLFQTMLIITKPKEDKRLQFRAYIPCKNLMLVEHLPGEPASFNVIPFDDPKGVMKLTARHREEKRVWTQQIKQAMLEHYDIPKRAKELVLLLGDEDERFTDKPYWKRPTNNSPVPEYLERRQQFRRSEMRMRSKKNLLKKDSSTSLGVGVGQQQQHRGALSTPSFRSYSSEFECVATAGHQESTAVVGGAEQPTVTAVTEGKAPADECKCDAVKKQLQEEIKHHRPEKGSKGVPIKPPRRRTDSVNVEEEEEELLLLKSLNERRKLTNPMRRNSKVSKESLAVIKAYNSTMIPKRISEMRKRRPKTLTGSSTFYTDLDLTEDVTNTASTSAPVDVLPSCHESETAKPDDALAKVGPTGRMPQTTTPPPPSGDDKKLLREHSAPPAVSSKVMTPGTTRQQQHMKDSEIISKLLLDVEQFNKMFHKQPKKKSSSDTVSLRRHGSVGERKPEPPSTEPPCEEDGNRGVSPAPVAIQRSVSEPAAQPDSEPIYESLLRNVHVPYKYAPPALARHSLPCGETGGSVSDPILPPRVGQSGAAAAAGTARTRPESDYVTLAYSELGLLQGIAPEDPDLEAVEKRGEKERTTPGQLLRSSDTNISYHREVAEALARPGTEEEEQQPDGVDGVPSDTRSEIVHSYEEPLPAKAFERQGSLSMKGSPGGQKSILQRFISLHTSPTGTSCGSDSNLLRFPPLQRKLSEPNAAGGRSTELGSLGHIYKQGSMDLGSRIAHLDYADPRTLFPTHAPTANGAGNNVLINRVSMQSVSYNALASGEQQRDSMLASSSSSSEGSVCEDQQPVLALNDDEDDENCCFYERTVEECLEHDFRDSAVYSGDDNDRRTGGGGGHAFYETPSDSFLKTPPTPPSPQGTFGGHPPPIPAKPSHLGLGRTKYRLEPGVVPVQGTSPDPSSINPKPSSSRGWVLQQVRRFQ
ncbi:uncharacterized protein LOC128279175 [Anopheles cruzii]|uniref:uncharacterized protein LOC128279175 n=1 Tax=Anopheles cruzii TaxID=68878 RepID=UPI0022EC3AF9|nr:uncharacterized protein LOC128279175 [Anopheles cruzii]